MSESLVDAALKYAAAGWVVLPLHHPRNGGCSCHRGGCESVGKHPCTKHGVKDASKDPEVISAWWRSYPEANIGIATGKASGILVLEVDGPSGDASLAAIGAAIPTRTNITKRGRHLFFMHPGVPIPNRVRMLPDLDVRGDGGMIVVPPSLHASGHRYHWDCEHGMGFDLPLAPLPPSALDAITNGTGGVKVPTPLLTDTLPRGRRNDTLTSWAGRLLAKGLTTAETLVALEGLNLKCQPALSADELRRIVGSIASREASKHPLATPLRGCSVKELLAMPDAEWTITGLLPKSALILLVGRWGAGKTFLLLDWTMHVATGMAWQGCAVQGGPVLFVFGEGQVKQRVAAWLRAHRVDASMVPATYAPGSVNLLDDGAVTALLDQIAIGTLGPPPVMIVFETLSRMTPGGDENSPQTAGLVIAACERIQRETGAAVLLSHHTPWNPEQQRPRGHTKLPDSADAVFLLKNKAGALSLRCQKMRDHELPPPVHLKLTPLNDSLIVDRGDAPPPELSNVEQLLAALGSDELTMDVLTKRLKKSRRTIEAWLREAGDRVAKVSGTGVRGSPARYHVTPQPPLEGGSCCGE